MEAIEWLDAAVTALHHVSPSNQMAQNGRYYQVEAQMAQNIGCTAMHTKLLKWDPGDSLCGVGWGVGACGLGELSGLHKNPRQSSSSLQNIDNDIHEAKSINRQNQL